MSTRYQEPKTQPTSKERGIALVSALFVLLLLTLLGLSLMMASATEILVGTNYRQSRASYFSAEAGEEEARYRLTVTLDPPGISNLLSDATCATTAVYIRASTSIDPTNSSSKYYDSEWSQIKKRDRYGSLTTTSSGLTTATYRSPMTSGQPPYAWAKVTRKTELLAGQNFAVDASSSNDSTSVYYGMNKATGVYSQYVNDLAHQSSHLGNPVYLITAMATDSTGGSRKLQTEVARIPPESVGAAVDSFEPVTFHGNLRVDGHDECNATGGVVGVRSHGTVDAPNGSEHVDGVPVGIQENSSWSHDIPSLIDKLRRTGMFLPIDSPGTNVTCSGTSCDGTNVTIGTYPSSPGYFYAPGDLSLRSNGSDGFGILIVNGDLTFHGGFSYNGLILCNGTINFTGGGSDRVNIHGAVIAAESINDSTTDLGGHINILYNSCDVTTVYQQMPMMVLSYKNHSIY